MKEITGPGTAWGSTCPSLKEVVAERKKKINMHATLIISCHEDQPVHDPALSKKNFFVCNLLKKIPHFSGDVG